jgi:hypothetical protein
MLKGRVEVYALTQLHPGRVPRIAEHGVTVVHADFPVPMLKARTVVKTKQN